MKNKAGRVIPSEVLNGKTPYAGAFAFEGEIRRATPKVSPVRPGQGKIAGSLEEVIKKTGLKDGMTISFHHHFREGDHILNTVLDTIAAMGIKDLSLASSSLGSIHTPLIRHIKNGVVTRITTSGLRGELAEAISGGIELKEPVMIRSHGGRARAVETGDIKIDVAFLGAASSDECGNASGTRGKASCGSLGYARVDSKYADQVVILTDTLVEFPNMPASIPQVEVDHVVVMESIGDPKGIASGATRYTKNPKELLIAEYASKAILASGYYRDGYSFQTGTGGASLAVSRYLKDAMIRDGVTARFALGGITQPIVEMLDEGLIRHVYDVQGFDLFAVDSIARNNNHHEIDAAYYASPFNKGCIANELDVVVLSALEIDTDFNVNVMTGSDGVMRGASGGHSDTAACAKMTVIVTPLTRGRIPCVVESVNTIITPGESIDVVVTDVGIAVHPSRSDLHEKFKKLGIPLFTIEELKNKAYGIVGTPDPIEYEDQIVALVEYRDGTILDVVRKVKTI